MAFVQAFGHHDDIGGAVPGSMPSHATSVFEEGLMVPPIRLWDAGVPNRAALTIMTRNSRMPESLAADLDAECSACLMGARRLGELFDRYGVETVESCFDAILSRTTETYRREILGKIPVGSWVWEDYAEHDGVDEPMLHTQRITLTRTAADDPDGERLILDFGGTSPQAKGPINHVGDASDGVFLKKWLAPILRNLADTPERMAELDVNEGVVPLIEMRFPPPGTLLTPVFPAPTNARTFVILRLLGVLAGVIAKAVDGRMPADQETIRYTGVYGDDLEGRPYLMREVLGGGSGGRYYADGEDTIHVVPDSRNLPTEFTEARFPFRVESLSLAVDSGGAGQFRGGLGYEKSDPDAQGRPLHVHRGPVDPGLLGRPRRQGRPAVPGHHRRGRPQRARGRRAGRRRAGDRRRGDPDPHHRWWRLGQPARARPGPRRTRRGLAQGVARGRARRLRRGAHRVARRRLAVVRRPRHRRRACVAARAHRRLLRPRSRLRPALRRRRPRRRRRPVSRPQLAEALDLEPHPEGGWFRQTWVSPETVTLPDGRVRATATLIHFLLPAGESSAWHRVASDEVWLGHLGEVTLQLGGDGDAPVAGTEVVVGTGPGAQSQAVVPAGVWQRTLPGDEDALVSCLVSPGFDFADFELA